MNINSGSASGSQKNSRQLRSSKKKRSATRIVFAGANTGSAGGHQISPRPLR